MTKLTRTTSFCSIPGAVLAALQSEFVVVAAEGVRLQPQQAAAFHAVYKGVVPAAEFAAMTEELSSSMWLADCKPFLFRASAKPTLLWLLLSCKRLASQ